MYSWLGSLNTLSRHALIGRKTLARKLRILLKSNSYSNKEWKDLFPFTKRNRIASFNLRFTLFL